MACFRKVSYFINLALLSKLVSSFLAGKELRCIILNRNAAENTILFTLFHNNHNYFSLIYLINSPFLTWQPVFLLFLTCTLGKRHFCLKVYLYKRKMVKLLFLIFCEIVVKSLCLLSMKMLWKILRYNTCSQHPLTLFSLLSAL